MQKKKGCKKKVVIGKCNLNKHHYLSYTNTHIYPCTNGLGMNFAKVWIYCPKCE